MKRILLITGIIILLFLPIASFAAPQDYLVSEGSSYGHEISKEAKQEALKANRTREQRFLKYQSEIDKLDLETPELRTTASSRLTTASNTAASASDATVSDAVDPGSSGSGESITGAATTPPVSGDDITPSEPATSPEPPPIIQPPPEPPPQPSKLSVSGIGRAGPGGDEGE